MNGSKTVFIVDDHPLLREGIKTKLRSDQRFDFCGEAGTARDAFLLAQKIKPDIFIMDISLPDRNGLELTREIKQLLPTTKVLILSVHIEPEFTVEAFQAGADGYLSKETAPENLLNGLETVASGKYYLDPAISPQVVSALLNIPKKIIVVDERYESLTAREKETLRLVAEGLTSKKIAKLLNISVKTVETHRANLLEKLKLSNMTELIRYAMKIGLIKQ